MLLHRKTYFRRKAYRALSSWKEKYNGSYAALLEGARRVGKSTIAENFAKNEYKSYIKIDFANSSPAEREIFKNISNLDSFFLSLQTQKGVKLYKRESVILLDEIQLFPQARQAIKYLVEDGRYDYIETGSLISIRQNVKDILIPSEEHKIEVHPMDFEEFLLATEDIDFFNILKELYLSDKPVGNLLQVLMKKFRLYMAIGGMPQAVEAYCDTNNFFDIDDVKRKIIELYKNDFYKIDPSGKISSIFSSIPSQLFNLNSKFSIPQATHKQRNAADETKIYNLLDSKTVVACYKISDPLTSLSQSVKSNAFKLYFADTGIFTTMLFSGKENPQKDIYKKLVSDRTKLNLGYLYENAVAQMIASCSTQLYYYSWRKENSTHNYEIDFLLSSNTKLIPIEVKSSSIKNHNSITAFLEKYHNRVKRSYIISSVDRKNIDEIENIPIFFFPFLLGNLLNEDESVKEL